MGFIVWVAAVAAALSASGADEPAVRHLGQPCRAKNILAGRVVVDRASGSERLVLSNTNETAHAELIFIDFENDTGKVYRAPGGAGSWAVNEVPGDRLVVGTFYDGLFMVFDLKKMEFTHTADFKGESYIWNLAMGGDGRVYGGTYSGGKLGALDLNTYEVEDCGAPAPPNLYLRYVSAMPDGRVMCHFYTEKPTTLIYDPSTKKFSQPPAHLERAVVGATWNGVFIVGSTVCDGTTLEPVEPPFPTPPPDGGPWSVDTYMTTPDTLFLRQGTAIWRFTAGDEDLTLVSSVNLRGGRPLGGTRNGALLGVRGQDYFVIRPGETELRLRPIPVESAPRPTLFVRVDPTGRIWGGPHFGQTLFWMDPASGKTVNTGAICEAGGEVYDVAFKDGKVYAASYSGGDIVVYDPNEPWDQWNHRNPRVFADVGDRGYIRPTAGILVGPDGNFYSGWMVKYGAYGGAVAITNGQTGETELIENPLGEQAVTGIAVDTDSIYVGTSLAANGLPNKKDELPRFGVIDRTARQVVFRQEIEGAGSVDSFALDSASGMLALSAGGRLRLFDTARRRFADDLAADAPPVNNKTIRKVETGRFCYASGQSLISLNALTGEWRAVAELPARVTCLDVTPEGVVYAACGVDVYEARIADWDEKR